jgi:hypothetical protein
MDYKMTQIYAIFFAWYPPWKIFLSFLNFSPILIAFLIKLIYFSQEFTMKIGEKLRIFQEGQLKN